MTKHVAALALTSVALGLADPSCAGYTDKTPLMGLSAQPLAGDGS